MKKSMLTFLLCALFLSGCAKSTAMEREEPTQTAPAETVTETAAAFTPTSAKSVVLYDMDKGADVCAWEPDTKVPPGAMAKLVTAMIVLENCGLDDTVTAGTYDLPAGSIIMNLKKGDVLTVRDLSAAVVLYSASDAAMALAEHVAGSQEAFVEKMNQRVAAIGCTDTKFADVLGRDATACTTAHDLVKIVEEALKNDDFRQLFGTKHYTIPGRDLGEFYTKNYMMDQAIIPDFYDERVTGGMQSYSRETGASLVCTVEGNYIAVVLGAERIFAENGWQVKSYGNFDEMTGLLAQYVTK